MACYFTITAVSCGPAPPAPTNGYQTFSGGTHYDDTLTFHCNNGYTLSGSHTSTCQADTTWSSNTPTCTRMYMILYTWALQNHNDQFSFMI